MSCNRTQRGDRGFQLLQCRRILLRHDHIDLVRKARHRLVEADQVFRRRQPAQRVAHFGKSMLNIGERALLDAGNVARLAAFRDALGQPRDLLLDRIDLAPRHGVVERIADLDELARAGR